jgi:hypothetical protein
MQISQLDEHFEVTQYRLRGKSASVALENGTISVQARYDFFNVDGHQSGTSKRIDMIITPQQSEDLKAILGTVLQATNAEIEAVTGWTQYDEREGES